MLEIKWSNLRGWPGQHGNKNTNKRWLHRTTHYTISNHIKTKNIHQVKAYNATKHPHYTISQLHHVISYIINMSKTRVLNSGRLAWVWNMIGFCFFVLFQVKGAENIYAILLNSILKQRDRLGITDHEMGCVWMLGERNHIKEVVQ